VDRCRELDAVRGIAALIVVCHHSFSTMPEAWRRVPFSLDPMSWVDPRFLVRYTPLHLLVSGHESVILFFVLSGFVLAASLSKGDSSYSAFVARRVCRIWLPFIAAILVSATLYLLTRPAPVAAASDWFNLASWTVKPTLGVIAGHLLMLGTHPFQSLDNPMWSLVIEMRVSLVFPLLWLATMRHPLAALILAAALYAVASSWLDHALPEPGPPVTLAQSLVLSSRYMVFFVLGTVLHARRATMRQVWANAPAPCRFVFLAVVLLLFSVPAVRHHEIEHGLTAGLGAAGIITVAISSSNLAPRVLRLAVLQWLGRVSYSLYLLHVVVLLVLVHLLGAKIPLGALAIAAIPCSLAAAELMHRTVERPCIRLGYKLAKRLDARLAPRQHAPYPADIRPDDGTVLARR
jgi:peptidoglycan/LPS O-acetylase OafA/YrhL